MTGTNLVGDSLVAPGQTEEAKLSLDSYIQVSPVPSMCPEQNPVHPSPHHGTHSLPSTMTGAIHSCASFLLVPLITLSFSPLISSAPL